MKIKRLTETAQLPTRASDGAAGLDLYADVPGSIAIYPGETKKIHTGIAVELRPYHVGLVDPRSGLSTKQGLRLANSVGVIDSDYRGEIIVALHNDSQMVQYIENGERIAQLVVMQYEHEDAQEVEELSGTQRGSGGFGSTGVK